MTHTEIAREFEARKPWITKFVIEGQQYGGSFDAVNDGRLHQFFACFPSVQTVLELGSLEGGHTIGLARHPSVQKVVGVEARIENLEKAIFVRDLLNVGNIEFVQSNLETADLAAFGTFDALLCSGLLYHLPEPWKLVRQFPSVSRNLFLWTHYADERAAKKVVNGYRGVWFKEGGIRDPLSGVSRKSFWPTLGSLLALLTENGYDSIRILENNPHHPNGPSVTLAATSSN